MYQLHLYQFNTPWNPTTAAKTEQSLARYTSFRDKYHVPIWLGESGENDDAWVRGFREMLEKDKIGWCFWPYKKVDATSSIVSIAKPDHWDEIVKYSSERRGVGNTEKQLAMRPSPEIAAAALNQLLENAKLAKCRVNTGYIDALGLTVPAGGVPIRKAE
jgi:endoglucanase